jgi:hypothetical protein
MKKLLFLASFILGFGLNAQDKTEDYSDHTSDLDHILSSLYQVISGDAGVKRDWELFRHLFHPEAKLIPVRLNPDSPYTANYLSPEQYIERSGPILEKNGFFEKEIHRVVEQYGSICHVFSTYESFKTLSDIAPFARGINSIQLMFDGSRWWIINIYWQGETKDYPLPARYLK